MKAMLVIVLVVANLLHYMMITKFVENADKHLIGANSRKGKRYDYNYRSNVNRATM